MDCRIQSFRLASGSFMTPRTWAYSRARATSNAPRSYSVKTESLLSWDRSRVSIAPGGGVPRLGRTQQADFLGLLAGPLSEEIHGRLFRGRAQRISLQHRGQGPAAERFAEW